MKPTRKIGSAVVTVLEIETSALTPEELAPSIVDGDVEDIRSVISASFGTALPWSFTPAVIFAGDETVLFDTGNGFTTGAGRPIRDLLVIAGVAPKEITTIVISHAHGDHIGGLVENGQATFPGARLVFSQEEHDFWISDAAAERMAGGAAAARAVFDLYAGNLSLIPLKSQEEPGSEPDIAPGCIITESGDTDIRALPLAGHTPGHMGIEVSSNGQNVWMMADTSHFMVQLNRPDWSPVFDVDPVAGAATRRRAFETAAENEVLLHMFHYPYPGFGRIRAEGQEFRWEPDETTDKD